jgi:hypothetical protein
MLLGIINILAWGVGSSHKVHGCGLRNMTTLLKQFEQAELPMQNLSKLHGVFRIGHWNQINVIEQKKCM